MISNASLNVPSTNSSTESHTRMGLSNGTIQTPRVVVLEDDPAMRQMCCDLFLRRGYRAEGLEQPEQILQRIRHGLENIEEHVDLVLSDVRLGRGISGLELLQEIKALDPELPVILMTGYATVPDAVRAMKSGACDYITKPFERAELVEKVEVHLKPATPRETQLESSTAEGLQIKGLIGQSTPMKALFEKIVAVSNSNATVLITGESGTGKELVARAIHQHSPRRNRPFIPVNCAALPENLMESELFGHESGAFSGAIRQAIGLFRAADSGTIFLDEVAEMALDTQAKLLRTLQDRKVRSVGSTRETPLDVRVIAATNLDVDRARKQGELRDDLFYRLAVVRMHLPPLRQRLDDLPLLLEHFLDKYARLNNRRIRRIAPDVLARLASYRWPGNVRELESVIESAYALGCQETLTMAFLPDWIRVAEEEAAHDSSGTGNEKPSIKANTSANPQALPPLNINDMERQALERALSVAQGNKSKAAQILGVSRKRLYRMLHDYGLAGKDELDEA